MSGGGHKIFFSGAASAAPSVPVDSTAQTSIVSPLIDIEAQLYEKDHVFLSSLDEARKVISGGFMLSKLRKPTFKMILFISSTFTDTHKERNYIERVVLPRLEQLAAQRGVELSFIDMRWGMKDENTRKQMTWEVCRTELEHSFEGFMSLSVISLQADKYGFRFIPRVIPQVIMDQCLLQYNSDDKEVYYYFVCQV